MRPAVRATDMISRSHVSDLVGAIADLSSMMAKMIDSGAEVGTRVDLPYFHRLLE